jgi:hypothetical protein
MRLPPTWPRSAKFAAKRKSTFTLGKQLSTKARSYLNPAQLIELTLVLSFVNWSCLGVPA